MTFMPLFRTVLNAKFLRKNNITRSDYDYLNWKNKKIISIASEDSNKPSEDVEHLIEDLMVVKKRRSDMAGRINRQLNHYKNSKTKLFGQMKLNDKFFNQYFPILLSLYKEFITFSVINDEYNFSLKFTLQDKLFSYQTDEEVFGSALIETNYQFYEDITFKPVKINQHYVRIQSKKETSKEDIKRPIKTLSKRKIPVSDSTISIFSLTNLSELLYSQDFSFIRKINIDGVLFFDLTYMINSRYLKRKSVIIKFIYTTSSIDKNIEASENCISIYLNSPLETVHEISVNPAVFNNFRENLQFIDSVQIVYVNKDFPIMFNINSVNSVLRLFIKNLNKDYDIRLFYTLLESTKETNYDRTEIDELKEFLIKNKTANINEIQFSFKLDYNQVYCLFLELQYLGLIEIDYLNEKVHYSDPLSLLKLEEKILSDQIDKEMKLGGALARILLPYIENLKNESENIFTVKGFTFNPIIKIDDRNNISSKECDCELFIQTKPCYHIFGLHAALIQEGLI